MNEATKTAGPPATWRRMLPGVVLGGALALAGFAAPAAAQEQPGESGSDATAMEGMTVVGSRIRRKDEIAANPVFTLEREELVATGAITIGELLQQLPAVGSSFNSTGSGGTAHGTSSMNLRNLGANRSLILVNGRRWVNGAGTRGFRDFVDLNTIPMAAVERIEVLLDGATAIYGADAIAGVVNIVTFSEYDGLHASAYVGETSEGDGFTHKEEVLWGKSDDWGSLLLSASFKSSREILSGSRSFSRERLQGLSRNTPAGRFRNSTPVDGLGTAPFVRDGHGGFRPDDAAIDRYNDQPGTSLVGPQDLGGAYAQLRLRVTDNVTFVSDGMFHWRKSSQRFSAATPRIRGGDGMTIPADHPYNPFGVEFRGSGTSFEIVRLMPEVGPRLNTQEIKTTRVSTGFEGETASGWEWDLFYSHGQNRAQWTSAGQIDLDRVALAIGPNDRCAANGCVPLDIFGTITPAMADYIRMTGVDHNGTKQDIFGANITGEIASLPAGSLGMAAGLEYRREAGYDRPSPYINEPPQFITYDRKTTSAPRLPTHGSYDVKEAYVEFNVPLLADLPGVRHLELAAASRHSRYSTFGSTTNSKLGLTWRPWEDLMLRTNWAQGFRAPSINELYAGLRQTNLPAVDPCNGGGAGLPGCAGVPASYHQANHSSGAILSTVGGNPELRPETSVNRSTGFLFTPHALRGFSWSVDWYQIDLKEAISSFGSQNLLNLCANTGQRCNLIRRDSTTGEIINLMDGPINLNRLKTSGYDTTLRYQLPKLDAGNFAFMLSASHLNRFDRYDTLPSGEVRVARRAGKADVARESFPRWKAFGSADWSRERWAANWSLRYIGSTDEGPAPAYGHIKAQLVHDAWAAYTLPSGLMKFTLGARNLFDKDPPLSWVNGGDNNFDMATYNPIGRFLYARAELFY